MNVPWIKDRLINVLIYGIIILTIGFALYKVFIQPTNKTSTVFTAPSEHKHYLEGAQYAPFSCAKVTIPIDGKK